MVIAMVLISIRETLIFSEVQTYLLTQYKDQYLNWRKGKQPWFDDLLFLDEQDNGSKSSQAAVVAKEIAALKDPE